MSLLANIFLKTFNYKIDTENIPKEDKFVILFAPHTSWTDFVVGKAALSAMGVKTTFLIKKEAFFFPLGPLLRWVGGYPVDRKRAGNVTQKIADIIKKEDKIALLVAPEGTRDLVKTWKKGFYHIAQKAEVPVALGYLDYHTRTGGIGGIVYLTGDYAEDLAKIEQFYIGMRGKRKGKFNLENKTHEKS